MMRLTTVILIATLMQVSAAGLAQKITMSKNQAPLRMVLRELRTQSGYNFVYADNILSKAKPVDISVRGAEFEEVLKEIFSTQPLSYTIDNKTITVKEKETGFFENLIARFQAIDVRGRVVDESGSPLVGATVKVKGLGKIVTTNSNGEFYIYKINENEVLVITYTGYLLKEVNANSDLSSIKLEQSNSKLDEVQVIAYGTTSKRLSTGNVTTVKASDIEKQPVQNPLLALQGRIPGLTVIQSTGYAGTGVTVRIQGQNSIANGNDPLYVIDGIPYSSQLLAPINTITGSSGGSGANSAPPTGNPMNYINPNDIESIDVLKDADATAIYGSRAANGAILITTKKGKSGKLSTDFNIQSGVGEINRKLKLLDTEQYLELRREALKNDNITDLPDYAYDLNGLWNPKAYTDWQEELIGKTAHYNNLQSSISGGNENIQFIVSGTYKKQTAVVPGNFNDQTGSIRFNSSIKSANEKLKLSFTGSYLYNVNKLPGFDLTYNAIIIPPNAPTLLNADGSLNWAPNANGATSWGGLGNPLAPAEIKSEAKTNNILSDAQLSYQIVNGLEIKTSIGYNKLQGNETQILPLSQYAPEERQYQTRISTFGNSNTTSWIIEPQLNYKKSFAGLRLDALFGGTVQYNSSELTRFTGMGYGSDDVMASLVSAAQISLNNSAITEYRYNALFTRLNLNYKDKYLLNITGRRDGSSRFGAFSRYHSFGSLGGAYIFSEESLLKEGLPFLSFGKLRASYGTTGSDQIADYKYLSLYSPSLFTLPYQDVKGLLPSSFSNPYLQWEETKKFQMGIDLGFLKDRIYLGINYNKNRSSNQLLQYELPIVSGFGEVTSNFPAKIQNTGWEFSLNTTNINGANFKWTTNFNITVPKNKLVDFPNLETSSYRNSLIVGQSLSVRKAFKFAGVDSQLGVYQFVDRNGSITTSPNDPLDKYLYLSGDPKFYGGFQNSISYKGFSVDVLFQFVKQDGPNYTFGQFPGYMESIFGNQPVSVLDRWQKPGDIKPVQRYNSDFSYADGLFKAAGSDASFTDASYIRLKNLAISWQLPSIWLRQGVVKTVQVMLQGQNLLTFTKYNGLDPETLSSTTLPPLRILTLGLRASL